MNPQHRISATLGAVLIVAGALLGLGSLVGVFICWADQDLPGFFGFALAALICAWVVTAGERLARPYVDELVATDDIGADV